MSRRKPKPVPVADLHTPDELLQAADALLESGDPKVTRAVVLEAITALEAFVYRTVFALLRTSLDPLLVNWLEDKTRMDFDARLSVLAPIALGQSVDTSGKLWSDYKKARDIRHRVTHSGKKVTKEEAAFVLSTVRHWLAYLGSTAEVTLSLQGLKAYVETEGPPIPDGRAAEELVHQYFTRAGVAASREVRTPRDRAIDLVLQYDRYTVAVEVKVVRHAVGKLEDWVTKAMWQLADAIRGSQISRAAVVIFARDAPSEAYRHVRTLHEGLLSVVVIHAPDV